MRQIISPTRTQLEILKEKLMIARRGHRLLKDKRDGLMRKFLDFVKKAANLRKKMEQKILKANIGFVLAKAIMGEASVRGSLMFIKQEANVEIFNENLLSVNIPKFKLISRISNHNAKPYGFAFTSSDLDSATSLLSDTLKDMVDLASFEKACFLIANEIEKTRRRVNALEYIIIPETLESIRFISMKLSENERANNVRLMKVKDMVIKNSKKSNYI